MPNGTSIIRVPKQGSLDITLDFAPAQAKQVTSQKFGGVDHLHAVNNGQMIYLDPAAHQALLDSGAGKGDTVRLTKMRRGVESYLDVELVSDAQEPATPAPTPIRAERAPIVHGAAAPQLQPAPATEALPGETYQGRNIPTVPLARPAAVALQGALYAALDAALAAETYAREKGRALVFSSDDIRAMANTLFIEAAKKGAF